MTEEEHKATFYQIDGLLLPGGSADISSWDAPFVRTTKLYYHFAQEARTYTVNLTDRRCHGIASGFKRKP